VTARLLEGRPVADAIWRSVEERAAAFRARTGRPACLTVIRGSDPSAAAYARQIQRAFGRRGLEACLVDAPESPGDLDQLLQTLSQDAATDGVLLMTPLPGGMEAQSAIRSLDPRKDVDGQHPANLGRLVQRVPAFVPGTALGGLRLLQHFGVPLRAARAVVVGRSPVVGLPMALLLVQADATVTMCHSRTKNLEQITQEADILCVAVGRAGLVGPEHVRPGAVVVDFGTNPTTDGSIAGDVQTSEVAEVAAAITPVPGGTGPVTVAVLAEQTLNAAVP
jgi:methylenetetrahydrofolate dehydrogenase (NADP+)/methenyltetrahydrofolate cyclohydrolase